MPNFSLVETHSRSQHPNSGIRLFQNNSFTVIIHITFEIYILILSFKIFFLIWEIEMIIQCLKALGHATDEVLIEAIVKIKCVSLSEMFTTAQ